MSTPTHLPRLRIAAIAVATALAIVGCSTTDEDPVADESDTSDADGDDGSGEDVAEPVTLRMATSFGPEPTIEHFHSTVAELSTGSVQTTRIDLGGGPDEEQRIVQGVAAGDFDLGWVGTRAFSELGVTGFDALTAPFLIDSYPLLGAVLNSDIPDRMLEDLGALEVAGLAVIGGGLRKPIAVDGPLLGPDDYADITLRTFQSAGHATAIAALGATHSSAMQGVDAAVRSGEIHAIENTLNWYGALDARQTPYITLNVTLWPQAMALVANPDMLASLSETQASALREAATDTAAQSVELSNVDVEKVGVICEWGGRFAEATDTDLAALRQAVQPVYDELGQDADTAAYLVEIEALKASVVAEPLDIPNGCNGSPPGVVAEGVDDPSVLNGTYQLEWSEADLIAAGVPEDAVHEFEMAGAFTWTFDDGELADEQRDAHDAEPRQECTGSYGVTGNTVQLLRDAPCPGWLFSATWVLTDDGIVFTDTLLDEEPNPLLEAWLAGKPWQRVE